MNKAFKFKQFIVEQDRCAMKVGTDGVLLGAWASLENNPFSVLDIGAGTGVVSLMLAQRVDAQVIDALEIDDDAYEQCTDNFENSKWNDRLFCYHASLDEFHNDIEDKYDLIVCNPPFYAEDCKTEIKARNLARFQDALPFKELISAAADLLHQKGIFVVIIPYSEEPRFLTLCATKGLYPNKICRVKGNPQSKFKRSLLEFSFKNQKPKISELTIETQRHQFTNDYVNLTKDFYLKM